MTPLDRIVKNPDHGGRWKESPVEALLVPGSTTLCSSACDSTALALRLSSKPNNNGATDFFIVMTFFIRMISLPQPDACGEPSATFGEMCQKKDRLANGTSASVDPAECTDHGHNPGDVSSSRRVTHDPCASQAPAAVAQPVAHVLRREIPRSTCMADAPAFEPRGPRLLLAM